MIASRGTSTLCNRSPQRICGHLQLLCAVAQIVCRSWNMLLLPFPGDASSCATLCHGPSAAGLSCRSGCVALTPKSLPASFCFYTPHASMHFANSRLQIWRTAPQSWLPYLTRAMRSKIVAWVQNSRLDTYTSAQTTNAVLHSAAI